MIGLLLALIPFGLVAWTLWRIGRMAYELSAKGAPRSVGWWVGQTLNTVFTLTLAAVIPALAQGWFWWLWLVAVLALIVVLVLLAVRRRTLAFEQTSQRWWQWVDVAVTGVILGIIWVSLAASLTN